MGSLREFTNKYFSVPTQANVADVDTVIGIANVAKNNPDRLSLVIMNLSDTNVYISPDKNPSASHGILIQANGGFFSMNAKDDGALVGYEWNVYCTAATKRLFVLETEGGRS